MKICCFLAHLAPAIGHYYWQNFTVFHQFAFKIGVWAVSAQEVSEILLISNQKLFCSKFSKSYNSLSCTHTGVYCKCI